MSAWYVMSAMGLYAVDPVSATYIMSAPLFEKVTIPMDEGRELLIEAKRTSPDDKYIRSITVDGRPHDKLWIDHADLVKGAHIVFTLGPEPNKTLGVAEQFMPPSLTA